MTTTNRDLVKSMIDAMNAHDPARVASFASDDLLNHAAIPEAQGAAGLQRIFSKILGALGYDVAVVFDGTSALAALRQPPPPDFLLTDLRLPDLDGREVALAASRLEPSPHVALITATRPPLNSTRASRATRSEMMVAPAPVSTAKE